MAWNKIYGVNKSCKNFFSDDFQIVGWTNSNYYSSRSDLKQDVSYFDTTPSGKHSGHNLPFSWQIVYLAESVQPATLS